MMVAVTGLFLFALSAIPAHAAEKVTVKTGYLTCHEAAGWGFVIGSSHSIHCTHRISIEPNTIPAPFPSSAPTSAICSPQ